MKLILVSMIAVLICSSVATAAPSTGQQLGQFGLGVLGGAVGAIVAITVISVGMEHIETLPANRMLTRNAGDLFGSPVERGDVPIIVNREHTIGDRVEDNLVDLLCWHCAHNASPR